jgi:hypothetical protein
LINQDSAHFVRVSGGAVAAPSEPENFQNPLPSALITAAADPAGPRCGSTQHSTTGVDANRKQDGAPRLVERHIRR